MKKQIKNLLGATDSTLEINAISYLHRWTIDLLNEPCDRLDITFRFVTGIRGGRTYSITARDYDGILDEIEKYTKLYFDECAARTINNLRNGYME